MGGVAATAVAYASRVYSLLCTQAGGGPNFAKASLGKLRTI